jgi:isopenicillin N synthase-like dioxygenase
MNPNEPPIIDFSRKNPPSYTPKYLTLPAFYTNDKKDLINQIKQACEQFGFFQLINHAIPTDLQTAVLQHSKEFFNLPVETKEKYDQGNTTLALPTLPNIKRHTKPKSHRRFQPRIRTTPFPEFRKTHKRRPQRRLLPRKRHPTRR